MRSKAFFSFVALASVLVSVSPASALGVKNVARSIRGPVTQIRMEVEVPRSGVASELDILFVIDDSGSMSTHQQNLLANVDSLVKTAVDSGMHLHAGVVSTSMDDPSFPSSPNGKGELIGSSKKFASSANGDFKAVLTENLKLAMNTNGSGTEQPLASIQAALSEPLLSGKNAGFLRPSAALAIFVLTDADDQSAMPVADFVSFVKTLKAGNTATMHAGFIPKLSTDCYRSGESEPVRLEEALAALGGLKESVNLCDADFGSKLAEIGSKYEVIGLRTVQFLLPAIVGSIRAKFGNTVLPAGDLHRGWVYDSELKQLTLGKRIDWSKAPVGTPLVLQYRAE